MNSLSRNVSELRESIVAGKLTSEQITKDCLGQIEKHNPRYNAFISVAPHALENAKAMDQKIKSGSGAGKLAGVPIAIKDLLCTKGLKTTAGSKMLGNFIPPYSSTVVERLESAGAIVVGKTNLDEFAMGSSNETSFYGLCRNPWNEERVPGGSSGGSAIAVAAGMAPMAIGTDTGGSTRQPASFCGIVGVKPTYGRVSRYGIVAFASSLDQAGPMTRTVKDSALVLETISGIDDKDQTTADVPVPNWSEQLNASMKGVRIGIPKEYFSDQVHVDIRKAVEATLENLKSQGAELVNVSIPLTASSIPIYYLISASEASSNLARYDGVRYGHRADFSQTPAQDLNEFYSRSRGEGFGAEVKRRILLGTYALSSGYFDAYYKKACQVRRLLRDQIQAAFEKCDVLVTPVTTSPAFTIGGRVTNPVEMYYNDIFTTTANLVGIPAMSVPVGLTQDRLPIGVQIMANHFDESSMFNVAYAIEQSAKFEEVPDVLR